MAFTSPRLYLGGVGRGRRGARGVSSRRRTGSLQCAVEWKIDPSIRPKPARESDSGLPGADFAEDLPLSDELILAIAQEQVPDQIVNDVLWFLLGYQKQPDGTWNSDMVPSPWKKEYPTPPDFIGTSRDFSPEIDKPVKKAVQKLTRSIPKEHKQLLKTEIKFEGYQLNELTPNRTRRATAANWIAHYRLSRYGAEG
uniref:DUF1823 family protein n=1 Tax=Rhodosorus marinus TaxID=101924 RepID=A0A7S0G569_9RHOD|mmetsp:Transcript_24773/g.35689  ORF Transcript_24773/g.35689 Transcript_24773/m.35689 type:complete len:197 (+) Transcript_24773:73-663(+)